MIYNNTEQSAVMLRCAYPYGKQQTWLPTDLHKVGARLETVGIRTDVVDLNFDPLPGNLGDYDFIGIGVVGAPYIPVSRKLTQDVRERTGKSPMLGGPGVEYLTPEQFNHLYGNATQVRNDLDLSRAVKRMIPAVYGVSIANRIKSMDSERLKEYLEGEFSFFVSQGCKYACDFCAADRTRNGEKVVEKFSQAMKEDLEAITEKAVEFGIPKLTMYITSLDLFQNPRPFREALEVFAEASKRYGVKYDLRGLSRVDSFLTAMEVEKELYKVIPEAGLKVVGFGVDGTTEEVWRSQHKGNKRLSEVDGAFTLCSEVGITPEALMVMGFHDNNGVPVDNVESLRKNVDYSINRAENMGVVARPHVAKDMVPGNNGWKNPVWEKQRQQLLENPELFRNLDFVALASEITHPDEEFRQHVNDAYLDIVKALTPTGHCVTSPLMPYTGDEHQDRISETFNMLVPFDR